MLKPCVLTLFLVAGPAWLSSAQPPEESWDNLSQLRPGERIEVLNTKMKSAKGDFASLTHNEIALRLDGREVTVLRGDVASVKRVGESHRLRNVLLGLAIGAAGGLAVGVIRGKTYQEAGETTVFMAVYTPIGAGLGAAVGAGLPARSQVTVYRATALPR